MEPSLLPEFVSGDRINLCKLVLDFAKTLSTYVQEERERIGAYMPWVYRAGTFEEANAHIRSCMKKWEGKTSFEYAIIDSKSKKMIGGICIPRIDWANDRCEIGYWIGAEFEGKGFVNEALSMLENVLFENNFNRIEVICAVNNLRSQEVPKRRGYVYEGTLRKWFKIRGEYQDMHLYSKLRSS